MKNSTTYRKLTWCQAEFWTRTFRIMKYVFFLTQPGIDKSGRIFWGRLLLKNSWLSNDDNDDEDDDDNDDDDDDDDDDYDDLIPGFGTIDNLSSSI
jgi:hypothetical protein